jgi:hypothetical protein
MSTIYRPRLHKCGRQINICARKGYLLTPFRNQQGFNRLLAGVKY